MLDLKPNASYPNISPAFTQKSADPAVHPTDWRKPYLWGNDASRAGCSRDDPEALMEEARILSEEGEKREESERERKRERKRERVSKRERERETELEREREREGEGERERELMIGC